jgi:hypothetical protein
MIAAVLTAQRGAMLSPLMRSACMALAIDTNIFLDAFATRNVDDFADLELFSVFDPLSETVDTGR